MDARQFPAESEQTAYLTDTASYIHRETGQGFLNFNLGIFRTEAKAYP